MGGLVKFALYAGKLAGKGLGKATIAHPQWIVYKTTLIASHAVATSVKVAIGIAGGLLAGHILMGE